MNRVVDAAELIPTCEAIAKKIIANAPLAGAGYYKVPKVIER